MNLEKPVLNSKKACVITITKTGIETLKKIKENLRTSKGLLDCYTLEKFNEESLIPINNLRDFFKKAFQEYDTIIAIMATGIVIRLIAPLLISKDKDPGIIVSDPYGNNFISLLSGHLGNANENTRILAKTLKGSAIITTASDNLGTKAVDTIAQELNCKIDSLKNAKKVTALIIEGKKIGLIGFNGINLNLTKNFFILPYSTEVLNKDNNSKKILEELEKNYDALIVLSSLKSLLPLSIPIVKLIPQTTVIGIGMKRNLNSQIIINKVLEALNFLNLSKESLKCFATINLKKDEPGLLKAVSFFKTKLEIISNQKVLKVEKYFNQSNFVKSVTGLSSVSEPCGYIASNKGKCLLPAQRGNGLVISVWKEKEGIK